MASKFYNEIKNAVYEREVECVYNKGIQKYFNNAEIKHTHQCDGFVEMVTAMGKKLALIIEYKLDEDMSNAVARAKVLIQVVYYMKRFENCGEVLPNVCLVGDIDECFVLQTNELAKYLDEDVDWTISPSSAHLYNAELVMKISEDEAINPFIFTVDDNFSFKAVADKIIDLADNVKRYVRVTEHNISNIYNYFTTKVIKNAKNIQANDLVAIFLGVILDRENYYLHPEKPNTLVCKGTQTSIYPNSYKAFFSYFERTYTPQEKNKFAEISDRLIEDTNRRNKGEFYTPTLFVDYAHRMLENTLGEDWKEKFVVWDNCSGTKNLTRDYKFGELYCSTLENAELAISERYNKEATSFQFDFLNDSLDKLPKGLIEAFEQNKPIVFFINPPYATACNMGETSKKGINSTLIRDEMHKNGLGCGAENLQHQFLYRICEIKKQYNLTNCHIAIFSNPIYLSGGKQSKFLNYLCDNFVFDNGVLFNASNFSDVSDKWGITFNIWNSGINADNHNFIHTLIENNDGKIISFGEKNIYNVWDDKLSGEWVREEIKGKKANIELPCLCNALKIKEGDRNPWGIEGGIGYFHNNANSVQYNCNYVGMYCTPFASANGVHITTDNYTKCTALFSARKLIEKTWINSKDEYLAPNEQHERYDEFVNDSIIYSLFHSASNQSSLRNVEYKGKQWDIKNEFFFMSNEEMRELANENGNDVCYNDAVGAKERFVYEKLQSAELSAEAKAVYEKACELVRKSFKYRKMFDCEHAEYQINNWDCGWYQVKAILKEYMPNEYADFNALYKALADKMRPMVYELGFLK